MVGILIEMQRETETAPWDYRVRLEHNGEVVCGIAHVSFDGAVAVDVPCNSQLSDRVRLLLKALWKQAVTDGRAAPPRNIRRWRESLL